MYSLLKFFFLFSDIPVLTYHSIKEKNLSLFEKQLLFFKNNSFEAVNPYDFLKSIHKPLKQIQKPKILVTFDDGYIDFYYNVFPLFLKYKFCALVFLIVNKIGEEGYLGISQIKEMLSSNLIYFGSHTLSHTYLPYLRKEKKELELKESKKILEEKLKTRIDFLSYPWGGFDYITKKLAKEIGYLACFTTNQGIYLNPKHKDIFAIKRLDIRDNENFLKFLAKVYGLGYYFQRKIQLDAERGI